jgi:hypothetical protein
MENHDFKLQNAKFFKLLNSKMCRDGEREASQKRTLKRKKTIKGPWQHYRLKRNQFFTYRTTITCKERAET